MNEVIAKSPVGDILNIGRSRERAVYYRPDGTKTNLLPADAYHKVYYGQKGYTLKPKARDDLEVSGIRCPYCDFEPKNVIGLRSHLNKHVDKDKKEKE